MWNDKEQALEFCCEKRHSQSLLPPCATASLQSLNGILAAQALLRRVTVTCKVLWTQFLQVVSWGEQVWSGCGYGQGFQGCLQIFYVHAVGITNKVTWAFSLCGSPGSVSSIDSSLVLLNKQWGQLFASPADCRPWKDISRPGPHILPDGGGMCCLVLLAQKAGCKYLQGSVSHRWLLWTLRMWFHTSASKSWGTQHGAHLRHLSQRRTIVMSVLEHT